MNKSAVWVSFLVGLIVFVVLLNSFSLNSSSVADFGEDSSVKYCYSSLERSFANGEGVLNYDDMSELGIFSENIGYDTDCVCYGMDYQESKPFGPKMYCYSNGVIRKERTRLIPVAPQCTDFQIVTDYLDEEDERCELCDGVIWRGNEELVGCVGSEGVFKRTFKTNTFDLTSPEQNCVDVVEVEYFKKPVFVCENKELNGLVNNFGAVVVGLVAVAVMFVSYLVIVKVTNK